MASFRDQTKHVLHGSYQQLGSDLDAVFKQMAAFERSGEIDHGRLEVALDDARRSFDHWVDVVRHHAYADDLELTPNEEPAPMIQNPVRPEARNIPPFF